VLRYSQAQIDSNGQYVLDPNGNRIPKTPEEYVVEGGKFNLKNLTVTFNLNEQGFTSNKLNIG
jgi:hypothetical protein